MSDVRMVMVFVEITAWSLLVGFFINQKRIDKIWGKGVSLKYGLLSLFVGIGGIFIPI